MDGAGAKWLWGDGGCSGGGGAGEGHQDLTGHRVGVGGGRAGVSQTACKTPLPQNERIKSRFPRAYLSGKPMQFDV